MSDYCTIADVRTRASGFATTDQIADAVITAQMARAMSDLVRGLRGPYVVAPSSVWYGPLRDAQADIAAHYCIRYGGAAEGLANTEADRLYKRGMEARNELIDDKAFWLEMTGREPMGLTTTPLDDPTTLSPFSLNPQFNTPLQNFRDPTR